MIQFPLNHYVVVEGEVASDVWVVLREWLAEINSQQLTETTWVYSAVEAANMSDILVRLREASPTKEWKPFRILFFGPHSNGCYAYKMPSASISGDGTIGTGGFMF